MRTIVREAKKHDALLNFVTKERLSQISETGKHQGVVAMQQRMNIQRLMICLHLQRNGEKIPLS